MFIMKTRKEAQLLSALRLSRVCALAYLRSGKPLKCMQHAVDAIGLFGSLPNAAVRIASIHEMFSIIGLAAFQKSPSMPFVPMACLVASALPRGGAEGRIVPIFDLARRLLVPKTRWAVSLYLGLLSSNSSFSCPRLPNYIQTLARGRTPDFPSMYSLSRSL